MCPSVFLIKVNFEWFSVYATVNQLSGQFDFKPSGVLQSPNIVKILGLRLRPHLVSLQRPYGPTRSLLCKNYKYPLWTLLQSLRSFDDPENYNEMPHRIMSVIISYLYSSVFKLEDLTDY